MSWEGVRGHDNNVTPECAYYPFHCPCPAQQGLPSIRTANALTLGCLILNGIENQSLPRVTEGAI